MSVGGRRLVSEPLEARATSFDPQAIATGAPSLPSAFGWRDEELVVGETMRSWNSNRFDRGEAYRDRHWFEFRTSNGRIATVYFDRYARRGRPRWWLYTLESS